MSKLVIILSYMDICVHHFRFWDPYYYRRRQMRMENDGMDFVESVCGKKKLPTWIFT